MHPILKAALDDANPNDAAWIAFLFIASAAGLVVVFDKEKLSPTARIMVALEQGEVSAPEPMERQPLPFDKLAKRLARRGIDPSPALIEALGWELEINSREDYVTEYRTDSSEEAETSILATRYRKDWR